MAFSRKLRTIKKKCWVVVCVLYLAVVLLLLSLQNHQIYIQVQEEHTLLLPDPFENIFFLETSGSGTLSFRQSASIESAAKFIPHNNIIVFMITHHDVIYTPVMQVLRNAYDVKFEKITVEQLVQNTPVEEFYKSGVLQSSEFRVAQTSDLLRYSILWKFGGVYLDLDVFVLRPWMISTNTVVRENDEFLASCVIAFQKHHDLMLESLEWMARNYDPSVRNVIGPQFITQMVSEYHNRTGFDDIVVLDANGFCELEFFNWEMFFNESVTEFAMNRLSGSLGTHVWNLYSKTVQVDPRRNTAYVQILKSSSPLTYYYILSNGAKYI